MNLDIATSSEESGGRDGDCWQVSEHLLAQRLGKAVSFRNSRPETPP